MKKMIFFTAAVFLSSNLWAAVRPNEVLTPDKLLSMYKKEVKSEKELTLLREETAKMENKAVPTLIKVMKGDEYSDKNRWTATFMLGKIMGVKAAPYIAKYIDHPNWLMRVASLKTLLHLRQDKYLAVYRKALRDSSLLVRYQALENVEQMKLKPLAPVVWSMMYDKNNYAGVDGKLKRTAIIKKIIQTVGVLDHKKIKPQLIKLMSKPRYNDLGEDLDSSLTKLTGLKSPQGSVLVKREFWKKANI